MYIEFTIGDKRGIIEYEEKSKTLEVMFPDSKIKTRILTYLNTKRDYRVPESDVLDDYRIDGRRPIDSLMYMELALNEMYVAIDVLPEWNTQKGGT